MSNDSADISNQAIGSPAVNEQVNENIETASISDITACGSMPEADIGCCIQVHKKINFITYF